MKKTWMIITWARTDVNDHAYGRLLSTYEGTYEEAAAEARMFVENYAPIGVVGVIE